MTKTNITFPKKIPDNLEEKSITCKLCGMVWKGIMLYSCPRSNCPVQLKAIY